MTFSKNSNTLLITLQGIPAVAFGQEEQLVGNQTPYLSVQGSSSYVSFGSWKLKLPAYWRGKVRVDSRYVRSDHGYDSNGWKSFTYLYPKSGTGSNNAIVEIRECNAKGIRILKSISGAVGKVTLKHGKKTTMRMGDDGFFWICKKIAKGRYLAISVQHYGANTKMGWVTKSVANRLAKFQSLGKKKAYPSSLKKKGIPKTCLAAVGKGVSKR